MPASELADPDFVHLPLARGSGHAANRDTVSPREALPLEGGDSEATPRVLAYPSFTFTPKNGGSVGLQLNPGRPSRGEPMRISVAQD
jgi:hypothetical protein